MIYNAFTVLLNAGPTVMLPVIMFIIGLIFGVKPAKAFRSGLTIGIGFAGIKLIIGLLASNLGPAAQAMVKNFGLKLDVLDIGWGAIAAITWSSPIIPILIFAILLTNIVMLILKKTNTLDVDIWNYHHMAIVGVMTYFVTKNIVLGIAATVTMGIVTFKMSDWSEHLVSGYFELPGVSLPTVSALSSLIIAVPLNWLMDKIPGVNKIKIEAKHAKKYLGLFGEPMIMGLILGGVIGALAKYDIVKILNVAVNMAAVMVLIPKMTSLFMEGLMPISEAAKKFTKAKFKGRKFLIGLDAAVVVGSSEVITTSLIVIPLTIALAVFLPGNRVLPFADLAVVPFRIALVVALTDGNILKNIVIGLACTGAILLAGTNTATDMTNLAKASGIDLSLAAGALISSFAATSLTLSFIIYKVFTGNVLITLPIFLAAFIAIWVYIEVIKKKKQLDEVQEVAITK
ncbi:PTS galactitol transporter subunit IIC [Clostridium estertheticum]|uniref:PTS galactitol transporter subunit IIC n=1 Tax=Clostridium estertheticum TaxID=238834 RepID=UPI001C0BDC5A|nr:PTS transporter subunit IIC [Clostridium estertheticum]MBU3200321.1 PTS galactitol transporter subunit IIC [Clostridium estertheticum]WAG67155.1 PTS galactitol transporter subunit IIC [Clostridium estertheticum]